MTMDISIGFFFGAIVGIFIGIIFGATLENDTLMYRATKLGYAEYCLKTDKLTFKGECDK